MARFAGIVFISLVWFAILGIGQFSPGQSPPTQTLTERLLTEGPSSLAKAARERGDAVRGAILFSQKSLSCAACHARGASDLLGPDLSGTPTKAADEHIVESILKPSKVIAKGFESVKILTTDGRVLTGRIVSDHRDRVVLREVSENQKIVEIGKDEVQQISQDNVSAMPEKLADQLTDRQQFLDLVKYLIDISGTNSNSDVAVSGFGQKAAIETRIKGLALLDQFGCINCHAADTDGFAHQDALPRKRGPVLDGITGRIDPAYIARFISAPHAVKPGTSMPSVLEQLAAKDREAAAEAIASYLIDQSTEPFTRQAIDSQAADRGREVFHTVGCVACHSPRNDDGKEVMPNESVALGNLAPKYNLAGLSVFLENPHSVRPSGRMPNMKLNHWEAVDVANYLLQDQDTIPDASIKPTQATTEAGHRYFVQLGCVQCHESGHADQRNTDSKAGLNTSDSRPTYPPLSTLNVAQGCLSPQPGTWPRYDLDDSQKEAIGTAIRSLREPLGDQQRIVLTMETLRCFACHSRDNLGGITDERDIFFHTTNENLGPQGRIPPLLTGVGGKLKSKWLREVLVSGRSIRPYMNTRMPQFGTDNVEHLVDLFAKVDPKPLVDSIDSGDVKETKKIGVELVGNQGLNCIACHTFAEQPAQTMPAVDLTEMAERLHEEWFVQYMFDPQSLSAGTVMPSFWPGGKAIRKEIADGDSKRQVDAIWEYLSDGRQAREPRGLRREPLRLVAGQNHAVMLRRSYREIGKRGIGVGYPGQVNLAYDAEQMRLAMIWKGEFADPGGVWRSQGHGTVRPLGGDLIQFEAGPDLDDAQSPWTIDEGRPPNHQFTGYFLDSVDRPTFTYRFNGIDVKDYSIDWKEDASGQTILKRTIDLTSETNALNLAFRIANGQNVKQVDAQTFRINDALVVHIASGHAAQIIASDSGQRLVIPLTLSGDDTQLQIHYVW